MSQRKFSSVSHQDKARSARAGPATISQARGRGPQAHDARTDSELPPSGVPWVLRQNRNAGERRWHGIAPVAGPGRGKGFPGWEAPPIRWCAPGQWR